MTVITAAATTTDSSNVLIKSNDNKFTQNRDSSKKIV